MTNPRMLSAINGRKTYQTDKPCPVCQCQTRYTSSGQCRDCSIEKANARLSHLRKTLKEAHK